MSISVLVAGFLSVEGESTSGSFSTPRNNYFGFVCAGEIGKPLAVSLMDAPMSIPQI